MQCPICGSIKFQAGPRGGLAQNFRCENRHYWHVSAFGMERIEEPEWAREKENDGGAVDATLARPPLPLFPPPP